MIINESCYYQCSKSKKIRQLTNTKSCSKILSPDHSLEISYKKKEVEKYKKIVEDLTQKVTQTLEKSNKEPK